MTSAEDVLPEKGAGISVSGKPTLDEKAAVNLRSDTETSGNDPSIESDRDNADVVIVTGADAAAHLIPLRDDFETVLTFRSIILASGLACFQAVMNQIYQVS